MKHSLFDIRLSARILLICVAFTLPTIVLLHLAVRTVDHSIDFALAETRGTQMLRPLLQLLDSVPDQRQPGRQAVARQRGDHGFAQLRELQPTIGQALGFTAEGLKARKRDHLLPSLVEGRWQTLVETRAGADEGVKAHRALVADLRGMITHTGDLSNLILDPDLDSYYLMDAVLLVVPQLSDRLSVMRDLLEGIGARGIVSEAERKELVVLAALLGEADLDRLAADVSTTLNEDAQFYGVSPTLAPVLTGPAADLDRRGRELIAMLRKLAENSGTKPEVEDAVKKVQALRDEVLAFGLAGLGELDRLLAVRIAYFRGQRTFQIVATLVALFVSAVLTWFIVTRLNRTLRGFFEVIERGAGQLERAVAEFAQLSRGIADSSHQQAASLEETSAAMQEITVMADANAQHAENACRIGAHAIDAAEGGRSGMEALAVAIREIKESGDRVGNIVRTIEEIAFQTNILSLNAAVEAARAGESGQGFAVVADEVRRLAQRSAQAAHETTSNVEDSIRKSAEGVRLSGLVGSQFSNIVDQVRQVGEIARGIASSSVEQRSAISSIADSAERIDQLTQGNAARCSDAAEAAGQLQRLADELRSAITGLSKLLGQPASALVVPSAVEVGRLSEGQRPRWSEAASPGISGRPGAAELRAARMGDASPVGAR